MKAIAVSGILLCLLVVVLAVMDIFAGKFKSAETITIGFPLGYEFNVSVNPDEIKQHIDAAGKEQKESGRSSETFRMITIVLQRLSEFLPALIGMLITTGVGRIVPSEAAGKSQATDTLWIAKPKTMNVLGIISLLSAVFLVLSGYTGDIATYHGNRAKRIGEKTIFTINKIKGTDDEALVRQLLIGLDICYMGKCDEN